MPWAAAGVLAVLVGAYLRLVGLGTWPLAVDEFYLASSAAFVLERGLPEFPCGGYYARGLIHQYLAAAMMAMGMGPEPAVRLVSAIAGLLVLPAAFLITRHAAGRRAAWVVVALLALSTWQVEMARFGRMYALFQALFVWHLYHLYRVLTEDERWRWRWLIPLSLAGPLAWEGGVFLAVLNFLPFVTRGREVHWRWLPVCLAVLALSAWFVQAEFRFAAEEPPQVETQGASRGIGPDLLAPVAEGLAVTWTSRSGLALGLVSLAILGALGWRVARDPRLAGLTRLGLLLAGLFALIQQLGLIAAALGLLVACGWLGREELGLVTVRRFLVAGVGVAAAWVAHSLVFLDQGPGGLVRFHAAVPDFLDALVRPMLSVLPDIGLVCALLLLGGMLLILSGRSSPAGPVPVLLSAALSSLVLVALIPTTFQATRYFFFSYPLLIVLAVVVLRRGLAVPSVPGGVADGILAGAAILFLASSDFHWAHLRDISGYRANFRIEYPGELVNHYYARHDHSAPGDFLANRVAQGDAVVTTHTAVSAYLPRLDAVYLDRSDPRYFNQACDGGTRERWTGEPLLDSLAAVRAFVEGREGTIWLVIGKRSREWNAWEERLAREPGLRLEYTTPDDALEVYFWPPEPGRGGRETR